MSRTRLSLFNQRFGKLIAIEPQGSNNDKKILWLCMCDCGNKVIVVGKSLKNGTTKSCGCLNQEKRIERFTKHGHKTNKKSSKTYRSWDAMIQRCINQNHIGYQHYGGRGITVCQQWLEFKNFLKDMGEPPTNKHQINRINNDQGYCKENCNWVTLKTNNRNRRNNHLITYNKKTQCLSAWAEEININVKTLWHRIFKLNWPIEKALITPIKDRKIQ